MRDRDAYLREGRNDPLSPDQLRDHPYDFVSLPEQAAAAKGVGHHRYNDQLFSGTLTLVYETLTPLHVGSGVFETAQERGLDLGRKPSPVRGVVRQQGQPVLPGSSWKGAIRSRFEAITGSRLAVVDLSAREPGFKVPDALKGANATHRVRISDSRVCDTLRPVGWVRSEKDLDRLSPAEALFGCMGYRGRVHPGEGKITGPAGQEPLGVAPLDSPVMHRIAAPGAARNSGGTEIEISLVEGRKFYYDGDLVSSRSIEGRGEVSEQIDCVPAHCRITIDVHLESVSRAELGALLVSTGHGESSGIVRFGGYKPAGLGKVRLLSATPRLWRGIATRTWRRPEPESIDLDDAVAQALNNGLIDRGALDELHAVTTRKRP